MSRKHVEVKGNILVVLLMLDLLIKCGGYSTVPFLRHFVVHGLEARRPFTSMMRAEGMADGATSRRRNSELVGYKNTQKAVPIDRKMVVESTSLLLDILGVPDFKVDVWLCSESKIKQLNDDWRGVNESTDILSFPANDFIAAEVFDPTDPTLAFEKHLGDIVVAPNYVKRACDNDGSSTEEGPTPPRSSDVNVRIYNLSVVL